MQSFASLIPTKKRHVSKRISQKRSWCVLFCTLVFSGGISACKARSFNAPDADLTEAEQDAIASSTAFRKWDLAPLWPRPQTEADRGKMLSLTSFPFSQSDFLKVVNAAALDSAPTNSGEPSTAGQWAVSNPNCFRDMANWKVTAVRFSPFTHVLPGASVLNVASRNVKSDLQKASEGFDPVAEIRVVFQPWCASDKLKNKPQIFALDESLVLKFRLLPEAFDGKSELAKRFGKLDLFMAKAVGTAQTQIYPASEVTTLAEQLQSPAYRNFRKDLLRDFLEVFKPNLILPESAYSELQSHEKKTWAKTSDAVASTGELFHPAFTRVPQFENRLKQFLKKYALANNLSDASVLFTEGLNPNPVLMTFVKTPSENSATENKQWHANDNGAFAGVFAPIAADALPGAPFAGALNFPLVPLAVGRSSQKMEWLDANAAAYRKSFELAESASQKTSPRLVDQKSATCVQCHGTPGSAHLIGINSDEHYALSERTLREILLEAHLLNRELLEAETQKE